MMRESKLNLIPVDIIEQEAVKERVRFWIFLTIVSLLFLFFINVLFKIATDSISRDITALESESQRLSREIAGIRDLDTREKELLNIKARIQDLSRKGPMIDIFTAIDRAINDNIVLTHLDVHYSYSNLSLENKVEVTRKGYFSSTSTGRERHSGLSSVQTMEGNIVVLKATAQSNADIASMLARLSVQPLFRSVNLKYSKTGGVGNIRAVMFEIECRL